MISGDAYKRVFVIPSGVSRLSLSRRSAVGARRRGICFFE
jgi:hypothetical protein